MAWGIDGMLNAYESNRRYEVLIDLRKEQGRYSFLGYETWLPNMHAVWNDLTLWPSVALGAFGIGGGEPKTPDLNIAPELKDSTLGKKWLEYQDAKERSISMDVASFRERTWSVLTLNPFRYFNEGSKLEAAAREAELQANEIILPMRYKERDNYQAGDIETPNTPDNRSQEERQQR